MILSKVLFDVWADKVWYLFLHGVVKDKVPSREVFLIAHFHRLVEVDIILSLVSYFSEVDLHLNVVRHLLVVELFASTVVLPNVEVVIAKFEALTTNVYIGHKDLIVHVHS